MKTGVVSTSYSQQDDIRVCAFLIRRCRLTEESISRIAESENATGLGFSEAALHLGLVSADDIRAAQHSERRVTTLRRRVTPSQSLTVAHDPYALHSESVRDLRTELLLRHQSGNGANVVAVMSPCRGEGRSQLAAELAIAFSQLGRPTLLVDADLRKPRQHSLFDADNQHGLAEAIATGSSPYLHPVTGLPELNLLTAGQSVSNPLELLSDSRFEDLLREWRIHYSHIVFDTAPVSQYSDGLAVAKVAGRTLALSRAAHTPYAELRDMQRRLLTTQSQILGAVINYF